MTLDIVVNRKRGGTHRELWRWFTFFRSAAASATGRSSAVVHRSEPLENVGTLRNASPVITTLCLPVCPFLCP